jgi:hypothetical protein
MPLRLNGSRGGNNEQEIENDPAPRRVFGLSVGRLAEIGVRVEFHRSNASAGGFNATALKPHRLATKR